MSAARPDQVSKTAESGVYVAGSFIVRGAAAFRNTPVGVAIGLQVAPVVDATAAALGRHRAGEGVGDPPARAAEPNDTARKVIRALREKLPEDEWKGLKGALNTEAVAAFVPPGGSDIVEP